MKIIELYDIEYVKDWIYIICLAVISSRMNCEQTSLYLLYIILILVINICLAVISLFGRAVELFNINFH